VILRGRTGERLAARFGRLASRLASWPAWGPPYRSCWPSWRS